MLCFLTLKSRLPSEIAEVDRQPRRISLLSGTGWPGSVTVYDFFIGRELNPRIGDFDLKQFCDWETPQPL